MTTELTQYQPAEHGMAAYQPQPPQQPYREDRTVQLTDHQIAVLSAPIPPYELDITADGKLHVPFSSITNRFNSAFGIMQWRLDKHQGPGQNPLVRSEDVPSKGTKYEVILTCDLIVQGITVCTVSDSAFYYSYNNEGTYGNAVESAKSKCLYEAAKACGIGLEIKDKAYQQGWKQTYGESYANNGKTYWRRKLGESVRQSQIIRLFGLIADDKVTLYRTLPTLINRMHSAPEMETMIGSLQAQRAQRNRVVSALPEMEMSELVAKWRKAGITDEVFATVRDATVRAAENSLWEHAEAHRAQDPEPVSGFQDTPVSPEMEPNLDPSSESGVPSDAPGMARTGKGKVWHEFSSSALEKWYSEKEGNSKMRTIYHSAMAIKASNAGVGDYAQLMATDFYQVLRMYHQAKGEA